MKLSIKEGIKTLVLAPAVAGLGYVLTSIMYSLAVTASALPSGIPYPAIVGAVAFAVVVINGMDKIILDEN
jgi:hypothetical protein